MIHRPPVTTIKQRTNGECKPVTNTRRVERTLQLVAFLSDWHTIKEIAHYLDIHYKSTFRYLNMLTGLGSTLESAKLGGGKKVYRITNAKAYFNLEKHEYSISQ